MTILYLVLITCGFIGGIFLGHLGTRTAARVLGQPGTNQQFIHRFAIAGSVAVVPIVAVVAFLAGGNIGGGFGAYISESAGVGSVGAPFGIALGIALVLAVGLTIGAFVGGSIGYVVALALGRRSAG